MPVELRRVRYSDLTDSAPYDRERENDAERQALLEWQAGEERRADLAYNVGRWLLYLVCFLLFMGAVAVMRTEAKEGANCGEYDGVSAPMGCGASDV